MIAKATAREAGARFINLDVSQITDKNHHVQTIECENDL